MTLLLLPRAPWRAVVASLMLLAACATTRTTSVEPTVRDAATRERDSTFVPRIDAVLSAFMNNAAVLAPDGHHYLFRSDREATGTLYLGELGKPELRKLAGGDERVASAIFTPKGDRILFRQDRGANEQYHIYAIALDGSGRVDLTPEGVLWRDHPVIRGDTMYYTARHTDNYASTLYAQALAPEPARAIYTDPAPGVLLDVSPDGRRGLMIREATAGGHELLQVDMSDGHTTQLGPRGAGRARMNTAVYSADGATIYLAQEGGLYALDAASGAERALYPHTVGAVVPSPLGDRIVVEPDGATGGLGVLDAATLVLSRDIVTPPGSARLGIATETRLPYGGAGVFSADGSHFVLDLSGPLEPDDIALVELASGTVERLRADVRPGLNELGRMEAAIVSVPAFDGQQIPCNVYRPAGDGRHPTIVYFHGGPDAASPFEWNPLARVFVSFGYAVVEPNIRGSTGYGAAWEHADDGDRRGDALRDAESVNQWVRAQPFSNGQVVAMGASYGGYMVLMVLTRQPAAWAAGIDLVGISDLSTIVSSEGGARRYLTEFGDPKTAEGRALLAKWSPLHDAARIVAPLFVYQGSNDDRVPRAHADAIVASLRERGHPVEYMVPADEGHSLNKRPNQLEFYARAVRFLSDVLGR